MTAQTSVALMVISSLMLIGVGVGRCAGVLPPAPIPTIVECDR